MLACGLRNFLSAPSVTSRALQKNLVSSVNACSSVVLYGFDASAFQAHHWLHR
jgi:hypothetical protein